LAQAGRALEAKNTKWRNLDNRQTPSGKTSMKQNVAGITMGFEYAKMVQANA
jgi:hypothetical protein